MTAQPPGQPARSWGPCARASILTVLAFALAALAGVTAAGAATWSAPQTLSAPHTFAGPLSVATRGDGGVVAAWPWQDNVGRDGQLLARLRRPGHGWGAIQRLATSPGSTNWALAAAIDGRGQIRVVWRRDPYRGVTELRAAAVPVGANVFTRPQTLVADGASADLALVPAAPGWAVADVEATHPAAPARRSRPPRSTRSCAPRSARRDTCHAEVGRSSPYRAPARTRTIRPCCSRRPGTIPL